MMSVIHVAKMQQPNKHAQIKRVVECEIGIALYQYDVHVPFNAVNCQLFGTTHFTFMLGEDVLRIRNWYSQLMSAESVLCTFGSNSYSFSEAKASVPGPRGIK